MSALRLAAVTLWTNLLNAMRNDGIIAPCIDQSGPQTTAVIVQACEMMMAQEQAGTWLPMSIHPEDCTPVVAVDEHSNIYAPIKWSVSQNTWLWSGSPVEPSRFTKWTYVRLPTQENSNAHH